MLPLTVLYFPKQQQKPIGFISAGITTQQEVTKQNLFSYVREMTFMLTKSAHAP